MPVMYRLQVAIGIYPNATLSSRVNSKSCKRGGEGQRSRAVRHLGALLFYEE